MMPWNLAKIQALLYQTIDFCIEKTTLGYKGQKGKIQTKAQQMALVIDSTLVI